MRIICSLFTWIHELSFRFKGSDFVILDDACRRRKQKCGQEQSEANSTVRKRSKNQRFARRKCSFGLSSPPLWMEELRSSLFRPEQSPEQRAVHLCVDLNASLLTCWEVDVLRFPILTSIFLSEFKRSISEYLRMSFS